MYYHSACAVVAEQMQNVRETLHAIPTHRPCLDHHPTHSTLAPSAFVLNEDDQMPHNARVLPRTLCLQYLLHLQSSRTHNVTNLVPYPLCAVPFVWTTISAAITLTLPSTLNPAHSVHTPYILPEPRLPPHISHSLGAQEGEWGCGARR